MIKFKDFQKLELVIATIVGAGKIKGSDKLVKLNIDLGKSKRQIVAGIGKFYKIKSLVGKQIVVVANLEPVTLMGVESQGMLLAADVAGKPVLLKPDKKVKAGTKVK